MTRTRWLDIAAIALSIAIAVGIADVSCSAGVGTPVVAPSDLANQQASTSAQTRPLALFIGDSYTEGSSSAEMSYGCRAVAQMDLLCAVSATGGTGYVSGGDANRWVEPDVGKSLSISERIPHLAAKYDPAVVILDGGRNDEFPPREDVYAAMVLTIKEVRRTWPEAPIVFIRPRFLAKPGNDLGFDNEFMASLESEPATEGVAFIDPIGSLADTNTSGLLASDRIHPNREGEQRLTEALLDSLVSHLHHVGSSS
jgi:lysophospholipase L1-like esterase